MRVLIVDSGNGELSQAVARITDERLEPTHCPGDVREVVAALSTSRYDVVVAVDQPGTAALSVMSIARLRQPSAIRVAVLGPDSGRGGEGLDPVLAETAHRVLDKMPTPRGLQAMLVAMDGPSLPPPLLEVVGEVAALPSVADVLDQLRVVLDDPDSDARDIARVVGNDPGLAAKTLQLANSAFVGSRSRVMDLEQAAAMLGRRAIQQVLVASMAFSAAEEMGADPWLVNLARRHGGAAAAAVQRIPDAPAWVSAGALLIDIGMPLMSLAWPRAYADMREVTVYDRHQLVGHEQRRFGVTHAEPGAALIRRWGLPREIVRMVASHHLVPLGSQQEEDDYGFVAHYLAQRGPENGRDPYDYSASALASNAPQWLAELPDVSPAPLPG